MELIFILAFLFIGFCIGVFVGFTVTSLCVITKVREKEENINEL